MLRHGYWLGLLLLCSAYLQGGIFKALDFPGAIAEMQLYGMAPAAPFAVVVTAIELGGPLLVLSGIYRWPAAAVLAVFTLTVTLIMNDFWALPAGPERLAASVSFFERVGLVGAWILVAVHDRAKRRDVAQHP